MNVQNERQLARIEGKINIIARGVSYALAALVGLTIYTVLKTDRHALVYAWIGAALAGGMIDLQMRSLEKRLSPYGDEDE